MLTTGSSILSLKEAGVPISAPPSPGGKQRGGPGPPPQAAAAPPLVSAQDLEDLGVIDGLAAEAASADQRLQHQPRVVHLAVVEESRSPQPVAPKILRVVADLIRPPQ